MSDLIIPLVIYTLYTLPLFIIAVKSEHSLAWLAFVPLANLWLMCDMADKELAWILLLIIPVIGPVIFYAMIWMALAENTHKPPWVGLLTLLPVVGIFVAYYMAVYEPQARRY